MIIFTSLSCLITAAFLFYLASPNQLMIERESIKESLSKKTTVRWLLVVFVLLVALSFFGFVQVLGKPASVFIIVVVLILVWTLIPFLITSLKPQQHTQRYPRTKSRTATKVSHAQKAH